MPSLEDNIPPACRRLQALAERDPRRAVRLARCALQKLQSDDALNLAWAHYTLGWTLLCWERPDDARADLLAAQDAFGVCGVRLGTLRCRLALLLADQIQLARLGLEQDFAALAEEFVQAGDPIEAARVELHRARQLNVLGRPLDAEAILTRIAPVMARGTPLDQARLLRVQGVVANLRNNFAYADDLLSRAEQGFSNLCNHYEVAKCWFEQAWVALRQERLDVALAGYRRAEQVFRQLDLPLQLAFCSKNIGLLMSRRGAYDIALQTTLTALANFTALRRMSDIGACHLHIGNIYFYTSRWEAAQAAYTRAQSIYSALGLVGYTLVAKRNRAMVYRNQNRRTEAQLLLSEVEALAREIDNQMELAEAWRQQAELLADDGLMDEAITCYRSARDLFTRLGNTLGVADCGMEEGWLALKRGAVEEARSLFQSVAQLVIRHPYNLWRIEYGLARCAEIYGEVAEALERYRAANVIVAQLRRRLASEEISSDLYAQAAYLHTDALRLATKQGAAEAVLELGEEQRALVLQQLLASRAAALPEEYRAEHDILRAEIAALVDEGQEDDSTNAAQLDTALAAYGDLLLRVRHSAPVKRAPLDVLEPALDLAALCERLRAAYGEEWTALTYIVSGDALLIGVITPEDVALAQTPYDERFRRLVSQASQRAYRRYTYLDVPYLPGRTAQAWAGLRALADRLLPELVRKRLHPEHRLLIVPAGPLHTLPWSALRLEDGWLAERAVVQLAPSLTVWHTLGERQPSSGTAALLVGCSEYGDRARALPAVGAELAAIAARWPGPCDELRDERATRAALLERSERGQLAEYQLLHFAGHARLLSTRGLAAHLKLWDSDLLLPEVAGLRLDGALVSLSACDGAAADALPGEEVLSLSWAFLASGANGVLASLWPVDDTDVLRIMVAFYDALLSHGDVGLALAQAQRSLIAEHDTDGDLLTAPIGWGSFVLTGIGRLS